MLYIVGILLMLILLVFIVFAIFQQPTYSGTTKIMGIEKQTTVYFDKIGVPHIEASSEKDAYTVLGYVHAQDRLWQMELLRRIAAGRLSELFGEKTIEVDRFFKTLCIDESIDKTLKTIDTTSTSFQMTKAYLQGVNQFIEKGSTPVEFHLLGLEKEYYSVRDVYNVFAYMAVSFAMAHKTDPMMSALQKKLGTEYIRDLHIEIDSLHTSIQGTTSGIETKTLATNFKSIFSQLPVPEFIGSNGWVLGPQKTKNGKVLFANDPHIGYAQPSVWYQAHLKTPTFESYGFHLGLVPFAMLAHNKDYAFGITMFENDDIDFYSEKNTDASGEKYFYKGEELSYELRNKSIHVKGGASIDFQVKKTIHGPIINDVVAATDTVHPIAIDWVFTREKNQLLEASFGMSHASSLEDFQKSVSLIHAPGLNVMYGDAKGNIAWWAVAKLFEHQNKVNPKFVLDGNKGEDDQLLEVDFSENPQAINPKSRYVYSANNQSFAHFVKEGEEVMKGYHGYYLPEDRAKRITYLLDKKELYNKEDMRELILDVTSSTALDFLSYFPLDFLSNSSSDNTVAAISYLKKWDGAFDTKAIAPTIYTKLMYVYLEEVLKDEMGDELFKLFLNSHIQRRTTNFLLKNKTSLWWDNINTKDVVETRETILLRVFEKAIAALELQLGTDVEDWQWGTVHQVLYKHPFGEIPLLKYFFNVGPYKTHGGNEVVNNVMYKMDSTGVYNVTGGPSTRRLIDFSNINESKTILPTGQSGNPFSKHYKDQTEKYLNGEFVPMLLDSKKIHKSSDKLYVVPVE
ncbi:MAG: penicillin acylase family protein [Flavicella sp.]